MQSSAQSDAASADRGSAELIGVLDTVDVPILVVDRDCTLVRFNQAAAQVFGLAPGDVGQLPCDTGALAGLGDITKLCAQVIADETPCRREIRNGDRRFLLRLAPYTGSSGHVEGAVLTFTNVTAFRASIEQAIYEREYTKAILNTVFDPLVVLDSGLRVQTANRAFYSMFGASRDDTQGVPLCDLGDEVWKTSGLWAALGAIVSADREFQRLEVERDFPPLGRRTVLLDARRLSRDGDATILLTFHDITDRKRAEEGLRRGQEELRDFVENASVGMHWVGPDGIIQWANRTELELLGYTREEFVGRHIAEFHADAPVIEDILRRLRNGETVHDCGARLRCKDGSIRDVLINSNVLWEGDKFVHTRCFTRDITERKRAEEALRESERRFREMINALPTAVYTTDAEGRLTHFNPACIELAGRVPELGIDNWCVTWKLYYPDGTPMTRDECPMAIALKEGRAVRGAEAIAERPDGTRVWVTPFPTPLRDAKGRLVGGINMLVDITDRKRAEQALLQSQKALVEADKRKDEFLATLAHELRNPLAPIRNSLHILRTANASNPDADRVREMMERQVAHMVRLVDDLLELSRISRGQIELKKELVGLATIIDHAIEASRPFIERHNHQLAVSLPTEPILVDGDVVRLSQVFANLLNNAAKYTQNGGRITLSVRREDMLVIASIRDTGIGIPSDMLSRVFDMFTQVDNVLRRSQDGLGIGLSLVRSLVAMHGGSVEAHSGGLGCGSEFTVRLPLAENQSSDSACSAPPNTATAAVPTERRILVVDDNQDAADTLCMFLGLLGADVQVVYDGQSALEALRICRPSVVLLDLGMPGLDGYEVAQRMRRDPDFCDLTLIALSGWGQEENRRRAREAGFDHHLVKPVDLDALQTLLNSLNSQSSGG